MPTGFCPALLTSIEDIADQNAPSKKLHIAGFLAMTFCCQNSSVSPVSQGFDKATGTRRPLTVKYRRRPTVADVSDTDTCDIDRIPGYLEWTIPNLGYKSYAFYLPDDMVDQYCNDAVATQPFGRPPTSVMHEVYDNILEAANAVLAAIDQDLVTQAATQFGENVTTGYATGKVINIPRNGNEFVLDNGIIEMMQDLQENEICGTPCMVGAGLYAAWDKAKQLACCNAGGMDLSKVAPDKFFFDKNTTAIWGLNSVGLFAEGSVKFIGRNKFVGSFAGYKGGSYFATFALPVEEFGCNLDNCLRDLIFDVQIKYLDCPQTVDVNDVPTEVDRGWLVIVSKHYGLWIQPTTAYASGDELENTNGTLKYYITNDTADTPPYALYYQ